MGGEMELVVVAPRGGGATTEIEHFDSERDNTDSQVSPITMEFEATLRYSE